MSFTTSAQWVSGMKVEDFLDRFFRDKGFIIRKATQHEERVLCLGDREFTKNNQKHWIEYKSGIQTHFTGNVFLETISVDTQGKKGWLHTSKADYIIYALVMDGKLLFFKPHELRARILELKALFREVKTSHNQNEGYCTHGLIVPVDYAEKHLAVKVLEC